VCVLCDEPPVHWLASALQAPEPVMRRDCLPAVLFLDRWLKGQREALWDGDCGLAIALLAKLRPSHIGLLFAFMIVNDLSSTWRQPRSVAPRGRRVLPARLYLPRPPAMERLR